MTSTTEAEREFDRKKERKDREITSVERAIRQVEVFGTLLICVGFVSATYGVCQFHEGALTLAGLGSYLQGAVGAPFALAAAAFVYVAFLGQKKQSLVQEKQIDYNERQITINRSALESQRAEQTFFSLFQKYHDIVTGVELYRPHPKQGALMIAQGKHCFEVLYLRLRAQLKSAGAHDLVGEYQRFFDTYQGDLAGYFAHVHQILSFLDGVAEVGVAQRFAGFFEAQLSPFEKLLIFYHALRLSDMKRLIEEFGMLTRLPEALLIDSQHKSYYAPSAFKF